MPPEEDRKDRILVVDDTPDSLSLLVDTLEHEGMTALVATSGEAVGLIDLAGAGIIAIGILFVQLSKQAVQAER